MFWVYYNLAIMACQAVLIGRALIVIPEAGPVAGGAFVLLAVLFNAIKYRPPER